MEAIAATVLNSGPAVKAGLEFVWIISFGQVVTIVITIITVLIGVGKLIATVFSVNRQVAELRKDVRALQSSLQSFTSNLIAMQMMRLHDVTKDEGEE